LVKFAEFDDDNHQEDHNRILRFPARKRGASQGSPVGPMDSLGRGKTFWCQAFRRLAALAALVACASGCVGPNAVRYSRIRYNDVFRITNDEQLLVNVVRLRYADSPVFIDLPNITSQFEIAGQGTYLGGYGNQFKGGTTSLGFAGLTARDTPTISYHPREGREISKALLTPLSSDLFIVVNAGANLEQLLFMSINDINDVQNATRATTLTPKVPDDNTKFMRGVRLLASLRDREATELAFGTQEDTDVASDPIPVESIEGRDILNAAHDGYVYRTQGDGKMTVRKREKDLYLTIRKDYINSPELQEIAQIFNLTPGQSRYKIKSELSYDVQPKLPSALPDNTIYLNLRSVLQIMTFLSKGVCVPVEHARDGIAPMILDQDGQPFDWTRVTAGNFTVHSQKHRPRDAEVAVHYRGYWFYIAGNDTNSRAILAILEILFGLQESTDGKHVGPLLTIPLG
jgi:hypothetical protein